MSRSAYSRSNIPYDRWSIKGHHHWHVSNIELRDSDEEEKDVIGRPLNESSNLPNLEALDQACKDLDLGQDFHNYGVAIAGADVVISLSTSDKDTLILPSDLLIKVSPWFESALDDRWITSKVTGTRDFDGRKIIMKRFELEHDDDHGDQLVGKTKITTNNDRISALPASICYDRDTDEDEHLLYYHLLNDRRGPLHDEGSPEDNEMGHIATIVANKIALSFICDFPIKLDRPFLIWIHFSGFATSVVLKLLQWFSKYLIPLRTVANAMVDFIFNSAARDEIARFTWTYLRISYVLQSRELFSATLYASYWEFDLQDISRDAGEDASLFYCVTRLREQILREAGNVKRKLSTLWPSSLSSAAILARSIWTDWLQLESGNRHSELAALASGQEAAQEILELWMTAIGDPLAVRHYEQLLTDSHQNAATVAALEDILGQAVSTTRKHFTKMTTREQPDWSFYAIDIKDYTPWCTPWSHRVEKQNRSILTHLVETAQLQYGEAEPPA